VLAGIELNAAAPVSWNKGFAEEPEASAAPASEEEEPSAEVAPGGVEEPLAEVAPRGEEEPSDEYSDGYAQVFLHLQARD